MQLKNNFRIYDLVNRGITQAPDAEPLDMKTKIRSRIIEIIATNMINVGVDLMAMCNVSFELEYKADTISEIMGEFRDVVHDNQNKAYMQYVYKHIVDMLNETYTRCISRACSAAGDEEITEESE